jgi:hypothetical protein
LGGYHDRIIYEGVVLVLLVLVGTVSRVQLWDIKILLKM